MRIGIDIYPVVNIRAGIGQSLLTVLNIMEQLDQEDFWSGRRQDRSFYLYAPRPFTLPFQNPRWQKRIVSDGNTDGGFLWLLRSVAKQIQKDEIDVFFTSYPISPFFLPVKQVFWVHDFTWKFFPKTMDPTTLKACQLFCPPSIRRADALLAVSQTTLDSLNELYPECQHKSHLLLNGIHPRFRVMDRKEAQQYIFEKFHIRPPYILHLGTVEPRKNLNRLLQAFHHFKTTTRHPHQLLIAGGKGWRDSPIYKTYEQLDLEGEATFLGYMPDEDMVPLYNAADFFIYPSVYEGFGIPPIEAMACGCPVIAADNSVFPEIVGEAGLLPDAKDPKSIYEAIIRMVEEPGLRAWLRKKGLAHSQKFSWEQHVRKLLNIFDRLGNT